MPDKPEWMIFLLIWPNPKPLGEMREIRVERNRPWTNFHDEEMTSREEEHLLSCEESLWIESHWKKINDYEEIYKICSTQFCNCYIIIVINVILDQIIRLCTYRCHVRGWKIINFWKENCVIVRFVKITFATPYIGSDAKADQLILMTSKIRIWKRSQNRIFDIISASSCWLDSCRIFDRI